MGSGMSNTNFGAASFANSNSRPNSLTTVQTNQNGVSVVSQSTNGAGLGGTTNSNGDFSFTSFTNSNRPSVANVLQTGTTVSSPPSSPVQQKYKNISSGSQNINLNQKIIPISSQQNNGTQPTRSTTNLLTITSNPLTLLPLPKTITPISPPLTLNRPSACQSAQSDITAL